MLTLALKGHCEGAHEFDIVNGLSAWVTEQA